MAEEEQKGRALKIVDLLRPHWRSLAIGITAIAGEGVADLLEPWPLKIVIDNVLRAKQGNGWLNHYLLHTFGDNKLAVLRFAALAVLGIAVLNAICSYIDKYVTTSVGQWVTHDLRRVLYSHVQRLSLAYHDQKKSGDLLSRVTSDIDSIQSFIVSGLLSALIDVITLVGMVGVMFYINWKFTLIALSVAPLTGDGGLHLYAEDQEGVAGVAEERRRDRLGDPGSAGVHPRSAGFCAGGLTSSGVWRRRVWRGWKWRCGRAV